MNIIQSLIIFFFFGVSLFGSIMAYHKCKHKKSAYGKSNFYGFLFTGFVWGDVLYMAPFWVVISLFCFIIQDFLLFLMIFSLFWLTRSIGETIYWFLQQFTSLTKNPVEGFLVHKIVQNDSVWFLNQLYWQLMTVITLVTSIYLITRWVQQILSHPYFLPSF